MSPRRSASPSVGSGWCSSLRATVLGLVALVAVSGCARSDEETSPAMAAPASAVLALEHATVVDPRDGRVMPDRTIVLEGGTIVAVLPAAEAAVDATARRVDATGKFVVPGYLEMHAHVLDQDDPASELALMLANGITGFRQMSGSAALLEDRRAGRLPISERTPALLAMPGQVLTPFDAWRPEAARATVREQAALGADFVKVGMVSAETLFAVLAEAERLGLPVSGHVPPDASVVTASEAGMTSVEHLGPAPGLSVACSSDEAALVASANGLPERLADLPFAIPFADLLADLVLARIVVNPAMLMRPSDFDRLRRIVATYDADRCRAVARAFVANGTWHVPTLIRLYTGRVADAPVHRDDPALRYVAPETLAAWRESAADFVETFAPADRRILEDHYARSLEIVRLLDGAGVPMLAGSDAGGAIWLVPGFALHRELDELAKAGVPPLHVLQMVTINGARFLGRTATMGTVEPGKAADLVLLDADPTESVRNLHRIVGVVRAGRYYGPADLEALEREVESRVAGTGRRPPIDGRSAARLAGGPAPGAAPEARTGLPSDPRSAR